MRNLGPVSARVLSAVGIASAEDLLAVGPVEAYCRIEEAGVFPRLDRSMLWALAGAVEDCDWRELSAADKAALERAVAQRRDAARGQ